jgi:UDP-N-acetyl-D-mannosaminuronic acid dehydrogenase
MKNATYLGLGYIGLPTAILTAKSGIKTFGYDIDSQKIDSIVEGNLFTKEPGLKEELKSVLESGSLSISTSLEIANTYVVVVPTPLISQNLPDISIVKDAINSVIPLLKKGDLLIIESTCPVLTTEKMSDLIFLKRPELENSIYLAYCPERVLPGNILHELVNNDRIVGGINKESSQKAKSFYQNFVEGEIYITNARTAEMCKLTENSARDAQIAFANELSMICDEAEINVWELIKLANKHPRVNILNPGIGVGGHCIAVDPWFLVADFPEEAKLIKHVREINKFKTKWCVNKIINLANKYKEKKQGAPKIACMGLSYKPNVDDLRESPAVEIVNSLYNQGYDLLIVEPNVNSKSIYKIESIEKALSCADIVVWLVAHDEFKNKEISENIIEIDLCGLNKN